MAGVLVKQLDYDAMFLWMILPCLLSVGYYYLFGRCHASSFNPKNRQEQHATATLPEAQPLSGEVYPLVVTISREYGSGGHRIGELLAKRLGVKFYDKELISLTAQQSGLSERQIQESEQTVNGRLVYDDPVQTILVALKGLQEKRVQ